MTFDLRLRDGHDTALTVCEGCSLELVPVYVCDAGERERPAWWEMPGRQRLVIVPRRRAAGRRTRTTRGRTPAHEKRPPGA